MKKRKINKIKVSIITIILILLFTAIAFGRYITTTKQDMYATSKKFFFTSDKLDVDTPTFDVSNWTGLGEYIIKFELKSSKNTLEKVDYDLDYSIDCETPGNKINYSINNGPINTQYNGIIYKSTNNNSISIKINPLVELKKGENVNLVVRARSKTPYKKEISARFVIKPNGKKMDYIIEDVPNQNYLTLMLSNKNTVDTIFSIEFDPNILRIDSNNSAMEKAKSITTIRIGENDYVNKVEFILTKETSKKIKFYKVDKRNDYTYPNDTNTSVIKIKEI